MIRSLSTGLLALALTVAVSAGNARAQEGAVPRAAATEPTRPVEPQRFEPATSSGAGTSSHAVELTPGLEVFGRYTVTVRKTAGAGSWDHSFDVPRVHAALTARYEGAAARVVLEGVRSSAQGALVGVAGDSVLLRLREAWAGYRAFDEALEVQLGIVPMLTIPALESAWGLRVVAPTPLEESALATPADLGVRATLRLPARIGWVGVVASNGEGYASRELNRGKNTELAAELHPLAPFVRSLAPLALFVSGVYGSQGVASSRAHRLTGGLVWRGDFREGARRDAAFSAGALVTFAWGVDDVASRRALLVELFMRAEPVSRLLLGARFVHFIRDRSVDDDRLTTLVLTVGYRLATPLELFVSATRSVPTAAASAALPGSNFWDAALSARVAF